MHHSTNHGFTLIELMIAVAIMAGLAAIAIPTYRGYVYSTRWQECSNEVGVIRIALEEDFLTSSTYPGGGAPLTVSPTINTLSAAIGNLYTPSANLSNCSIVVTAGTCGGGSCVTYAIRTTGINQLAQKPDGTPAEVSVITGP